VLPSRYVSLDDQRTSDFETMLREVEGKRVIFVGEIHGNPNIHLLQLEIIKHLHKSGRPLMVAMEAFPAGKQEIFDRWVAGDLSEYDFQKVYRQTWTVPFDYYKRILFYAREQKIALIAINADNALIGNVSKNGLGVITEDFLRQVKFSDCSTDPFYSEIVGRTHHASDFPFLCNGQRLRDSIMAFSIASAIKASNNTIVALVGATHAIRPAVPRLLQNHDSVGYTILLPETIKKVLRRAPDRSIADYIWYE
jgi:uncharacterized iron-regulated protein